MTDTSATASTPRHVSILGATGSVGRQTIDLIARDPERYPVEALTANGNIDQLAEDAIRLRARFAVTADPARYLELKQRLSGTGIAAGAGPDALIEAAERPAGWVMAAIVGSAGLAPTLAAVRRGALVALANKECLVCAGDLFTAEVERHGARLLPADSEHNAIAQILEPDRIDAVERVVLTASGGPFRSMPLDEMRRVTPEQAVAHPNWSMGAKISVDSATMMNKGLELIEAHHLFPVGIDRLDILVHPQSIVHGLVYYADGSVLAHLGAPDMRTPIAWTLAWPDRRHAPSDRLDLARIGTLSFEAPDDRRFPCLALARDALKCGDGAATILNAANEVAVAAFLNRRIGFLDIAGIVADTLDGEARRAPTSIDEVIALDQAARRRATDLVAAR
ncbi:1-deoxy-D-xylulose 5-phosphate reductoisomerase [Tistrella bauzanensis]|uniref:1-deoxy-D-xylulose 5-phosphate reductoisomerase n=1 Tax=Tistrella bauzanensis TaxID=657419 RepID=A0ABQ1IB25_9PROT|nr:1-deoxy-D-xylulose-5-phosphate reductoisomerase [Tistrella bauzanensis]GGB30474.1 1-deoxy-D-xylulose 5-phosphate reductoisomerase [Tistrella bauzanensis]